MRRGSEPCCKDETKIESVGQRKKKERKKGVSGGETEFGVKMLVNRKFGGTRGGRRRFKLRP